MKKYEQLEAKMDAWRDSEPSLDEIITEEEVTDEDEIDENDGPFFRRVKVRPNGDNYSLSKSIVVSRTIEHFDDAIGEYEIASIVLDRGEVERLLKYIDSLEEEVPE